MDKVGFCLWLHLQDDYWSKQGRQSVDAVIVVATILGLGSVGDGFLKLPAPVIVATLFFAVADLVAAVGLWLLASWGTVVWMISALTETALYGAYNPQFGSNYPLMAFHIGTVAVYALLSAYYERTRDRL